MRIVAWGALRWLTAADTLSEPIWDQAVRAARTHQNQCNDLAKLGRSDAGAYDGGFSSGTIRED
jgi:hypothetical protein